MPFRFHDEISSADVAFEAWGETEEELFKASAAALLATMVAAPDEVTPRQTLSLQLAEDEFDLLLWSFLQELIFYKDARRLLLHADAVQISARDGSYRLKAQLSGEVIASARHHCLVDVKAVTLHGFLVVHENDFWRAMVVLDV